MASNFCCYKSPAAAQQGAAPDRLQPTLVPRFGFRRRVSLVVVALRAVWLHVILLYMHKRAWAEEAVAKLQAGQTAQVRPTGHSMQGKVDDGDLVTLEPCNAQTLASGDIVLARIKGRRYFHLVLHLIVSRETDMFLIGNNQGRIDGWISAENIFGKVTMVQPQAKQGD